MNNSKEESKFKFNYPSVPENNNPIPKGKDNLIQLATNLFEIKISKTEYKLCIYDVSIEPEIAKDNLSLYLKIQKQIDGELNNIFIRKFFSGHNLFGTSNNPQIAITIKTVVDNIEYSVLFKLAGGMDVKEINNLKDFEGENQRKKSFIEKIIKEILLKNKNTIKFGDSRTIVKINTKNVYDFESSKGNQETLYKGYYTSAQITESGLFLLVLNVNKYIQNITVYEKIQQLRVINKHMQESEIRVAINNYFKVHPTCLTIYGKLRTYRINYVDFDTSPAKTCFNIKDGDRMKTITVAEYYKVQYKINIKDLNQPLLIVERKTKNQKNKNKDNQGNIDLNKSQDDAQQVQTIYLVPELLYITGNPLDKEGNNRREIIKRTKVNPNEKMKEIQSITDLFKSTSNKTYTNKNGKILSLK